MNPNELRIGNYVSLTEAEKKDLFDSLDFESIEQVEEYICPFYKISGLLLTELYLIVNGCEFEFNYSDIQPITLTEEWLIKLGFTAVKSDSYINGTQWLKQVTDDYINEEAGEIINRDGTWFDGIGTHQFKSIGAMFVNVLCRGNYVCNSVGTVHELQNLYFTLTGNELNIKQ